MTIGVGIDAVDVDRLREMLLRRPAMEARLFTESEIADAGGAVNRLAARFAAKEAVMKALGVGLGAFAFREVEVVRLGTGQPALVLWGAAAALAEECGVTRWHVSLTHTDHVAEAVVIAE